MGRPKMKTIIEGRKIYIRELTENDATERYCGWLNDPIVNEYLETREATIDDLKEYIHSRKKNPNCLFFGIFIKDNNEHIGNVKLEPIDFEKKTSEFGMMIGEKKYWEKGIGTEVTRLVVNYAFNELNLKKIRLGVIPENKAAIRVYEKVGFKITKIEKDKIRHGDKLFDHMIMEIEKST